MYSKGFILSTASSLEGYRIVEQCGVVFGETVFKHNAFARFSAAISDTFDAISFRSKEMSGSMSLIEAARNHAYEKMIREAKRRNANAIIAIESDNTIGSDVMYISLYGTAVRVISESEYEGYLEKARAEKEKAIKDQEKAAQRLKEINEMVERGEATREVQFLANISALESISEIEDIWNQYQFGDVFPEIDKKIKDQLRFERAYGKFPKETKRFIEQLKAELTGGE